MWIQQYAGPDTCCWRDAADLPLHALLIAAPYEADARFATKRETSWTGYKAHLTETGDAAQPHLITTVETTPATTADVTVTATIHIHLADQHLLPREHLLDAGYLAAAVLVASHQDHAVDGVGPVPCDHRWQARQPDGLDVTCFAIDWDTQQVTCPQGKTSVRWTPNQAHGGQHCDEITVQCAASDCQDCPLRARCTTAATGSRTMTLRPQAQHAALQTARQRQTTAAFKQFYGQRAGVEGTLS